MIDNLNHYCDLEYHSPNPTSPVQVQQRFCCFKLHNRAKRQGCMCRIQEVHWPKCRVQVLSLNWLSITSSRGHTCCRMLLLNCHYNTDISYYRHHNSVTMVQPLVITSVTYIFVFVKMHCHTRLLLKAS